MNISKEIALYGGAFDPPHLGHQFTLLYLLSCANYDEIWILPAYNHPFGKKMAPFELRYQMCQLLAAPLSAKIQVSRVEAEPVCDGRTYNTVRYLQKVYPNYRFSFVLGADNLAQSHKWYKWDELSQLVDFIVIGRGIVPQYETITLPDISSTLVRSLLAEGKEPTTMVPQNILQFIKEHNLYRLDG